MLCLIFLYCLNKKLQVFFTANSIDDQHQLLSRKFDLFVLNMAGLLTCVFMLVFPFRI